MKPPKLYAIVDKATLDARGMSVAEFAREMAQAGVGMLQYRDKLGAPNEVLRAAKEIAAEFAERECVLILNDRADLALLAGRGVTSGASGHGAGRCAQGAGCRPDHWGFDA